MEIDVVDGAHQYVLHYTLPDADQDSN
jgi:hypothetical protein